MNVGWLVKKRDEEITGGNSQVLFDKTSNSFLVDAEACLNTRGPTAYNRVPVCELTCLPLYKEYTEIYNLIGYNFQYVSQSSKKKALTTFLYQGYGNLSIKG